MVSANGVDGNTREGSRRALIGRPGWGGAWFTSVRSKFEFAGMRGLIERLYGTCVEYGRQIGDGRSRDQFVVN